MINVRSQSGSKDRLEGSPMHGRSPDHPLPQLLTPEEAAQYLGISSYTVRERLKRGEIPGRKHGARWLIRAADLAAYVEPNNAP